MVLMTEPRPTRPPSAAPAEAGIRELRCKKRVCRMLLASLRAGLLIYPDGARLGPIARGMMLTKSCPRCKTRNVYWL
jgi:phage FluMu protein Com